MDQHIGQSAMYLFRVVEFIYFRIRSLRGSKDNSFI